MKILIGYDGTVHAKRALMYGIGRIKQAGGDLTVLQVFDRSLFIDYDAGPGAEEHARNEAAGQLQEAKRIIDEKGIAPAANIISMEGDATALLADLAGREPYDFVMVPPRFKAAAKAITRPVFLIPGILLVPMDASGEAVDVELISREAAAIGASILLLGIVPEHLFSKEEKNEVAALKRSTNDAVKQLRRKLGERGIEATSIVRSGYPDEEILSAARDHAVSMILLPAGGTAPSELSKAAVILLDEPERLRWPVFLAQDGQIA